MVRFSPILALAVALAATAANGYPNGIIKKFTRDLEVRETPDHTAIPSETGVGATEEREVHERTFENDCEGKWRGLQCYGRNDPKCKEELDYYGCPRAE